MAAMDEMTFQQELRELKQRVSDMADGSAPVSSAPSSCKQAACDALHNDLFVAQLRDVKTRLDHMQATLPQQWQRPASSQPEGPRMALESAYGLPGAPISNAGTQRLWEWAAAHESEAKGNASKANARLASLEAQFIYHLGYLGEYLFGKDGDISRDVPKIGMNARILKLEQAVAGLEDNVAFTPDSSETSIEDLTASQEELYFPVGTATELQSSFKTSSTASPAEQQMHALSEGDLRSRPTEVTEMQPYYFDVSTEEERAAFDIELAARRRAVEDNIRTMVDADLLHKEEDEVTTSGGDYERPASVPELCRCEDEGEEEEGRPSAQGNHDEPASLAQVLEETCSETATQTEPFMAICPPKIDHSANRNAPANPCECLDGIDKQQHIHRKQRMDQAEAHGLSPQEWQEMCPNQLHRLIDERENEQLREQTAAQQHEIARLNEITHLLRQNAELKTTLSEKDATITHLNDCRSAAEEASQITRTDLEKRVLEAEDGHIDAVTEALRWRRNAETAQQNASKSFEASARSTRELQEGRDRVIAQLEHDLKQCEASRHHFMTKYVDENYRFKWLEQRKLQSEQRLQQQLDQCESALEDVEKNRDADIRHAVQSREDDLNNMHAFCHDKDAIAGQQEAIIAQGAAILQERDAEIDRLSAALDESQREERCSREHAVINARTIEKRDDEISDLHDDVKEERGRRCRLEELMRRDADAMRSKPKDVRFSADERHSADPFAQAAQAVGKEHKRRDEKPSWKPQPIRKNARLPHEENRASLWENGMHAMPKHRFGSASPIAQRRGRPTNENRPPPPSNDETRHNPRNQQHHPHIAQHSDPARQHAKTQDTDQAAMQLLAGLTENLQSQNASWLREQKKPASEAHDPTQQMHADVSSRRATGPSRMKAQAPTNSGTSAAENRRHALPLDATWLHAPASVEKMASVPNLRAGRSGSNHLANGHSAMSKPASMLDLRPQRRQSQSQAQTQTYHEPSVETEAESAADQGGSSLLD